MSNYATLWSQANCPYCTMASKLLWEHGYAVVEHKIGANATKEEFLDMHPGIRSVPQIWLNGELVPGGYTGLKAMLDD